tara:strand:- start:266 stop:427 length:162 start_codon:yes stop_codon:yes gene_type:complete
MVEFLLYPNLLCADADAIVLRIKNHEDMDNNIKVELIETVRDSTPHCPWDAND